MFEVEFRPRRRSDARSERCTRLFMLWFMVFAIIAVLFVFLSRLWASIITVIVLVSSIWFTWYYFRSAPPEPEQVEEHRDIVEEGLSPTDIANLPTFLYQRTNNGHDSKVDSNGAGVNGGVGWLQCAVCIAMVKEGETVRQLPVCKHVFHAMCIDKWLESHLTCPMCRADVMSDEVSSKQPVPPV